MRWDLTINADVPVYPVSELVLFAAILLLLIGCFNLVAGPANLDKRRR